MNDIIPTLTDLQHLQFWASLLLGIVAVLAATWWVLDYGIDRAIAWWHRRRVTAEISEFEQRQKLRAVMAIRGER